MVKQYLLTTFAMIQNFFSTDNISIWFDEADIHKWKFVLLHTHVIVEGKLKYFCIRIPIDRKSNLWKWQKPWNEFTFSNDYVWEAFYCTLLWLGYSLEDFDKREMFRIITIRIDAETN